MDPQSLNTISMSEPCPIMFTAGEKGTGHDVADEASNGKIKKRWKNKTEVNCKKVLIFKIILKSFSILRLCCKFNIAP